MRGKRADPVIAACNEYLDRLQHYRACQLTTITPDTCEKESAQTMSKAWPGFMVLLDMRGQQLSTHELMRKIEQWERQSPKTLTFVIGGAFGVSPALFKRADFVWSLGLMTLAHRLGLLLLCEQLYRVNTLFRGVPYSHY